MAKKDRKNFRLFGNTGPDGDFGQFGTANSPVFTKDIDLIQALAAWLTGWRAATVGDLRPAIQDMNSVCFVLAYMIFYMFERGVAEWDAGTTYYVNSIAQVDGVLYLSLQDDNTNQDPETQPTYWSKLVKDYVKVFGKYTVSGASLDRSVGIASVVKTGTGNYTINFTNAFTDANYIFTFGVEGAGNFAWVPIGGQHAGSLDVVFRDNGGTPVDPTAFTVSIVNT